MTLDLELTKDQGSFLLWAVPADNSSPTQVVIDAPSGVTRFVTTNVADRFHAPKGAIFYFLKKLAQFWLQDFSCSAQ